MSPESSPIESWVERIVALPRPLLLGFDVDGTLAPIVDDPASARVVPAVGTALRKLVRADGVAVALITGRDAAALSRMVRVPGAYRGVEHGRRVLSPGQRLRAPAPTASQRAALSRFEAWVQREAVPRGGELETKRGARGLHVRKLSRSDAAAADALLREAQQVAQDCGLHARVGRAVLEAELEPADKGTALKRVLELTGAQGVFFIGDDLTDFPAIEVAQARGGIGLFVRSPERPQPPGACSGAVDGPEAVAALIVALQRRLG